MCGVREILCVVWFVRNGTYAGIALLVPETKALLQFFPMRNIKSWNASKKDVFAMEVPLAGGMLTYKTTKAGLQHRLTHNAHTHTHTHTHTATDARTKILTERLEILFFAF